MSSGILVVGCGAIGGVLTATLLDQGHEVSVLTTNPRIGQCLRDRGIVLRGEDAPLPAKPTEVFDVLPQGARFDYVLLATQPPQVEEAARNTAAALSERGAMVCFQNGLCEERIAKIVGEDHVIGGVVAWGGSMLEPGVYERTSAGGFTLGRLDGKTDPELEHLGRVLEAVGPVTLTANLRGARWSKLAINAAISTLGTIGGDRLGTLMRYRHVRRLALDIMTETVQIARRENVKLEKVSGTLDLDWIALTDAERTAQGSPGLLAKHTLLLAVGARYRRLRSSMLSAIERGRPPAVDFLNGELVDRSERHGVPTPVNRTARDWVWKIARGELTPAHARLRELYEQTRS